MFHDVVATLSAHFVDLPPDQVDEGIVAALELLGERLPAELVSLFLRSPDGLHFERSHAWRSGEAERFEAAVAAGAAVSLEDQAWLLEQLGKSEVVSLSSAEKLPDGAGAALEVLSREGLGSALFVPMLSHGTLVGFMKIGSRHRERRWPRSCRGLLRIALDMIASAIERRRSNEALRRSELRLRRTQRLEVMGRLAGGVAHDFNNFLTAIIGYNDLLEAGLGEADPGRLELHEIRRAAERAAALVEQILSFGRQQESEARVVDLDCVVVDLTKILQRAIGEDLEVVLDLRDDLPSVRVDPARVDQALINLAVNARDAMQGGGRITISTDLAYIDEHGCTTQGLSDRVLHRAGSVLKTGDYVVVSVRDTGCGMDPATCQKLFEPFFTTKVPGKGTGLGLATVASIMEACEGGISIESEPGRGSVFHLYFPVLHDTIPSVEPRPERVPGEQLSGDGETVLVVDADQSMRALLRRVLEDYGYTVLEAEDGDAALRCCATRRGPIHLLVTDIVGPRRSACELAEQIARLRPGIRLLFTSSYPEAVLREDRVCSAEARVLEKPFTPRGLLRMVRELLASDT